MGFRPFFYGISEIEFVVGVVVYKRAGSNLIVSLFTAHTIIYSWCNIINLVTLKNEKKKIVPT